MLKNIESVSEEVKNKFLEIVNENVAISTVEIIGKIRLTFTAENGIELIKKSLLDAKKIIEDPKETRNLKINYIAAPYYRLEIISKDYLDAESILSDTLDVIETHVQENNGEFEFIRD